MIHIKNHHLYIIQSILQKYPYNFYAYGARINGSNHRFSDLDICFMDEIPVQVYLQIKEDFLESNLTFFVDIVDFNQCYSNFQTSIINDLFLIQKLH